jgi:hypothetical protein
MSKDDMVIPSFDQGAGPAPDPIAISGGVRTGSPWKMQMPDLLSGNLGKRTIAAPIKSAGQDAESAIFGPGF